MKNNTKIETEKQLKRRVAKSAAISLLEEIERLRIENGIEVDRMAFEAGHSTQYFKEIMRGKKMPGIANLICIIHALGVCAGKRFTLKIETT